MAPDCPGRARALSMPWLIMGGRMLEQQLYAGRCIPAFNCLQLIE